MYIIHTNRLSKYVVLNITHSVDVCLLPLSLPPSHPLSHFPIRQNEGCSLVFIVKYFAG